MGVNAAIAQDASDVIAIGASFGRAKVATTGAAKGITRQAQRALDKVAPYRKLHASGVIEKEFTKIFSKSSLNEIRLHLEKVSEKIGKPDFATEGTGMKWIVYSGNSTNGAKYSIRIMKGNPNAEYVWQRVDYVKVVHDGQVVLKNGKEITSKHYPKPKKHPEAHIPLEEWLKWDTPYEKVKKVEK